MNWITEYQIGEEDTNQCRRKEALLPNPIHSRPGSPSLPYCT